MAQWLRWVSEGMKCRPTVHDLEVMSSNPAWVEFGVRNTSLLTQKYVWDLTSYEISKTLSVSIGTLHFYTACFAPDSMQKCHEHGVSFGS